MIESGSATAVRLTGICKAYAGHVALHSLSITIGDGETIAIVGPSGSGKTTLLNTIAGVVRPDAGTVELGGRRADDLGVGRELARLVGIIHQQYDLVPQLSVLQNVLAGRLGEWSLWRSLLSLVWPRESERALQALDRVGLNGYALTRVARLSGGEQQRVAIARQLVQNPRIVLADEPVASVDPARAEDLLSLLTGIARVDGKAVIASLHTVEFARRYFDRIVGLRDGRVQFDRPAGQVTDAHLSRLYVLADRLSA